MKKALVLTVGTGTRPDIDIAQPLKKMLGQARPDRVVFLVSDVSLPIAQRIGDDLSLAERGTSRMLADVNSYERTFLDALETFRELSQEGFSAEQIEVDFTSGTKAMSVGLGLAAAAFGCGHLRYIAGERTHGVVACGTEEFLARSPARVRAYYDMQIALRLFHALQFEAARQMLGTIEPILLDERSRRVHAGLRGLVDAYDGWDKFRHGEFKAAYRAADLSEQGPPELADFRVSMEVVGRVQVMHDMLQDDPARKRRAKITPDHLADLWNNAERRRREGKYDDAVARLYRLVEMLAQYRLADRYGIDTDDVRLDGLPQSVPDEARAKLAAQSDSRSGRIRVGLRSAFELLEALGDPLGEVIPAPPVRTRLTQLLDTRNASILAHGLTPVGAEDAEALAEEVAALAERVIPDFRQCCADLQFPWLRVVS